MHFLEALNPEQREAVLQIKGALLILAGAGSGKTRVITSRIAYLVGESHAKPHEVLAVTFTNKAAEEMRTRVESLLGTDCSRMWVSTFHSLCARLLRREAPAIGLSRDFVIYDSSDQLSVVKQALKDLHIDESFVQPRAALSRISHAKNRMESPEAVGGVRRLEPARRARGEGVHLLPESPEGQLRAGLRRPPAQDRRALRAGAARSREVREPVPIRHGGRIPGHESASVSADPTAGRGAPQPLRRRRSRSVDLQVARGRPAQHPRLRAGLSGSRSPSSSNATTGRRRSSSMRRRPSSARTATGKTSTSGPSARVARASCTSAEATTSKRPTSSRGRPARPGRRRGCQGAPCSIEPTRSREPSRTR